MNPMMTGAGGIDPLMAMAALASGQQQPQPQAAPMGGNEVESPLARMLAYAQQQQAQLGPAPTMDASAMSDLARGQKQEDMAAALMGSQYVPDSGALGALAQVFSAYKGGKLDRKADETIADALKRQVEQQQAQAQYASRVKEFEEGPGKILSMAERAKATGYEPTAAELASGEYAKPQKAPTSALEFERAQADPEYAKFLEARRPKGSSTVINMPAGQKAFDVELGKTDAKTYAGWRDGAVSAQQSLQQLGQVKEVLSNLETGKVNEALATAGQYFGTEAGADLQTVRAAIVPLALAEIKKLGVNPTDADLKFINQGLPGFGTDPRANKRVIELIERGAQGRIQLFQEADSYMQQNDSLRGFNPTVPVPAPKPAAADPKDDPLGIL